MMQHNFEYSKTMMHHCREYRIPLIYTSSVSVYGSSTAFTEKPSNERPVNLYAYSKYLFGRYVRRHLLDTTTQIVRLRNFNVYGPREQHKGKLASIAYQFH